MADKSVCYRLEAWTHASNIEYSPFACFNISVLYP